MKIKEIYFAGGCFWGVEHYFKQIDGVLETAVGYANGKTENPTYEEVCRDNTGHAETVRVKYDENSITLKFLLDMFLDIIDPTLLNRQGNDIGVQYRTGVYYTDDNDYQTIKTFFEKISQQYDNNIKTEIVKLQNFYEAEEYHQDYLNKNSGGYCHINISKFDKAKNKIVDPNFYSIKNRELTKLQEDVAFHNATEKPYSSSYYDFDDEGIYVDIVSGEPLFLSSDKFFCACGWPSFTKPIDPDVILYYKDTSHGMNRVEVRSRVADIHLGHVFEDDPVEKGGLRYCINGAVLEFIPKAKMKEQGYEKYIKYLK